MSTFSGLGTALSSLIAQRGALDIAGQNVANANTVGYTRQRADIASVPSAMSSAMFAKPTVAGNGVLISGVTRLGDVFLDTRVRTQTATAGYQAVRADAYTRLESTFAEPGKTALSAKMDSMWGAWHDVANNPDLPSTRQVLIEDARAVTTQIHALYDGVTTQWSQTRTQTTAMVDQVNVAAAGIADLNGRIVSVANAGGNPNELIDKRDQLITTLSGLVGATANVKADGSADVMVGGNALVAGTRAHEVALTGATSYEQTVAGTSTALVWKDNPAIPLSMSGGRIAGNLTILAPADASGTGGILAEAGKQIDALASQLVDVVNTLHATAVDLDGNTAGNFFSVDATRPAMSIEVFITDPRKIGAADAVKGALDGSIADELGQIGSKTDGPNSLWNATVVQLGVRADAASESSKVAEAARASAESLQLSNSSVDTDEETVNMLAYQRAYEGAARVLTAIDEMLDTLINRTGVVGR